MKKQKRALITGITGQDGSYLAELLLQKGYTVYGLVRKSSHFQHANIAHIYQQLKLIQADLLDPISLIYAFHKISNVDEIYNLASQSSPSESFRQPIHTIEITGVGAQRLMEAAKDIFPGAKFYQASSSEMYGWVKEVPQKESTPFNPANPYAAAKLYAHNIANIYRTSYKMFVACGILFNHESPRRGLGFVTQKVTYAAACAKLGIRTSEHVNEEGNPIVEKGKVKLGNLDAVRDWGFAGDYVLAMWSILQQKKPDDFVIGTGESHTIRQLCEEAYSYLGLDWKKYVDVDEAFIRPTETGPLIADASKAGKVLKWKPKVKFNKLVRMLVDANIGRLR